jgi:hypothetical protein
MKLSPMLSAAPPDAANSLRCTTCAIPPCQPLSNQHLQAHPASIDSKSLVAPKIPSQLLQNQHLHAPLASVEFKLVITPVDATLTQNASPNFFRSNTYRKHGGRALDGRSIAISFDSLHPLESVCSACPEILGKRPSVVEEPVFDLYTVKRGLAKDRCDEGSLVAFSATLSPSFSYSSTLFCAFLLSPKSQPSSFQAIPHFAQKHRGWGFVSPTSITERWLTPAASNTSPRTRQATPRSPA